MESTDNLFLFKEESASDAENKKIISDSFWKVLMVDDDDAIHKVTQLTLSGYKFENKKLQFINAHNGKEAETLLRQHTDIAVAFLDVVMENDDTGLRLVEFIREDIKNNLLRIVIRTGQPGYAPESEVISHYDINDYCEKTDLTAKRLITVLTTSLRDYRDLKELHEAKQEIERANKIKEKFIANTSHELRTPLHAIVGFARILQRGLNNQLKQDTPAKELITKWLDLTGKICSASNKLQNMITDMIDLSQIDNAPADINLSRIDIDVLLPELVGDLQTHLDFEQNEFVINIEKSLGKMDLDIGRLRRILYHLLDNAIKFTKNGTVTLCAAIKEVNSRNYVEISVTDTGIGIDLEKHRNLFEKFTQIDDSATRLYGGSGLGLSIVNNFTRQLGGLLDVKSTPGQGSRFAVLLPVMVSSKENP